ncbi:MAG: dihydroorotate dehydrogenase-like protein [Anaerolineales bacterium]|nr:MAG: dihydroorotate dehydrogenase-like protein [Anaerolineales bacterium]
MVDISTTYLGMHLKNPLVASASPLSKNLDTVVDLEKVGISAVVMYSLFEEQIIQESLKLDSDLSRGTYSYAEALDYLPDYGMYSIGPESYIDQLRKIKRTLSIPVIGSLNGISTGGWIDYAQKIEQAGADALELNLYDLATDVNLTSNQLEERHINLVRDIRQKVNIPLAVKLSPFYTALPQFASRLVEAGANGLVLFNRFYQPDFDLEELEVVPNLVLSDSNELRLPLRWIAILYGRVQADFALTSGVHSGNGTLKAMMAGASVAMLASELLKNGIGRIPEILAEIETWMVEHEYESIDQMKGSMSQKSVADPAAFERANYMKVLSSY